MIYKIFLNLLLFLLTVNCICYFALAQNVNFEVSVDKNRVELGEQFEITFTLNGASGGSGFRAPSFDDFLVLSGPNQSTSMQIINGAMTASVSYSYILQPRSEGKFTIGSATINYSGKQLQTNPITIEVVKGVSQPKQQQKTMQQETDLSKQIADNVFLKAVVDKVNVYQGEQITASYKLYWRVSLASNPSISKVPSLSGFWSEELDIPRQNQISREIVNGKQYNVATLKKVALFPQRSGKLLIDPMEVECVVQVQTRRRSFDIFDQFFNDPFFGNVSNVNYKAKSLPVTINVISLPTENVPKGFAGAVGKFSLDAWLDKHQTKANEAVTLKVKISGRGNLKLIGSPDIFIPPDIEKYDPKISDNITKEGDKITGSRTFEYLLIPRYPGEQKIPSFNFTYFDVDKKSYITLNSQELHLRIEKGTDVGITYTTGISKEDVKLLSEDIRFIKSGKISLRKSRESFVFSPMFFVFLLSPIITFVGFVFYVRRREKIYGNISLIRNKRARKVAQKRLSEAKKFLAAKLKTEFYTEISRALYGYIGDKLGIQSADLSIELIRASLENRKISEQIIAKLISTIETCEFARFAPAADSIEMDKMYKETVELISTIEDHLR